MNNTNNQNENDDDAWSYQRLKMEFNKRCDIIADLSALLEDSVREIDKVICHHQSELSHLLNKTCDQEKRLKKLERDFILTLPHEGHQHMTVKYKKCDKEIQVHFEKPPNEYGYGCWKCVLKC